MKKKSTGYSFDVTMDSFNGAEKFELVRLYIHSKLEKILPGSNFGLCRDDGLTLLRKLTKLGQISSEYLKILVLVLRMKQILEKQIF